MPAFQELILRRIMLGQRQPDAAPAWAHTDHWRRYIQWQYESSAKLFAKFPNFEIRGKTVLEIGCGTGGRSAWLAGAGASKVTAIDINADEIQVARTLVPELFPREARNVTFEVSQEERPLSIGRFDVVVLVDCLEHVVSPPGILRLAYQYTDDGGSCFAGLQGWFQKSGSHFGIPFVNLFFSDEAILNAQRWWVSRPEYVPTRFDSNPPVDRWRGLYDLRQRPGEYLNKITIGEIRKLLKYTEFPRRALHVIGFGGRNPLIKTINVLRRVPLLQEVFHSYIVLELRR